MNFQVNILKECKENDNFRKVLFSSPKSQLVVMNIIPGGEIGEETHDHVEQILFNLSGTGKTILDGVESDFTAGDVVIVAPGTKHNIINTGSDPLKIYSIYVPANHIDAIIHKTKADADADVEDEKFGESVR